MAIDGKYQEGQMGCEVIRPMPSSDLHHSSAQVVQALVCTVETQSHTPQQCKSLSKLTRNAEMCISGMPGQMGGSHAYISVNPWE